MSEYLTYDEWVCSHEQAIRLRTPEDIQRLVTTPKTGTVETAAAQGWWLVNHYNPDIKSVVIRRPVEDVCQAMINNPIGIRYHEDRLFKAMSHGDRMLAKIAKTGCPEYEYKDLTDRTVCKEIFEYCLPYPFDEDWWNFLKDMNIQVDLMEFFTYYHNNKAEIEKFKSVARSKLREIARCRH